MMNATERQLRKIALILTLILALQFVWGGLRLWQTSEPDPIHPAESSLRVNDMRYNRDTEGDLVQALVNRPLFWQATRTMLASRPIYSVWGASSACD